MTKRVGFAITILLYVFLLPHPGCSSKSPASDSAEILKTLKSEHPRLFLDADQLPHLRSRIEADEFLNELYETLLEEAEKTMEQVPVEYKLRGPRLLHQSRKCLNRVSTLSLAFLISGDIKFADRAKRELFAAAEFPDWNPSHFLDVAEMTAAFGVGYDWLYHVLSDSDRTVIQHALLEKGLNEGLLKYEEPAWWVDNPFNWNQVCNGGLSVGALAVADEEPGIAGKILSKAVANIPFAMASYAPDGGWAEGPGYWGYATAYTAFMVAVLQSALGKDFGLSAAPGFDRAGLFPIHCTGPFGLAFNFADAGAQSSPMSSLYWLAGQFDLPRCALEQRNRLEKSISGGGTPSAWDLIWYESVGTPPALPVHAFYEGIDAVFFRSRWSDPDAIFVGFKGGDNQANHAHLDLGTFVLDAFGQRWAVDLGRDDYNLPGYWNRREGGTRWTYFRLNSHSHNTLAVNGDIQRAKAKAPIIQTRFEPENSFAVADLSEAYAPHAESVKRGIAFLKKKDVLVQDEIEWKSKKRDVVWTMMTGAQIELQENRARLTQNGRSLTAKILSPSTAVFDTASAVREPPERSNTGFRRLVIRYSTRDDSSRLAVLFSGDEPTIELQPLSEW